MTSFNERLDDILSKTPCVQCDGSGIEYYVDPSKLAKLIGEQTND